MITCGYVDATFSPPLDPYEHVGQFQRLLVGLRAYSNVSARVLSNHFATEKTIVKDSGQRNDLFWVYGQFLVHDITLTPEGTESWPIEVPTGDPVFDPTGTGTKTLPFTRTGRAPINLVTPFIDGSAIYGVDAVRLAAIRHPDHTSGALRVSVGTLTSGGVVLGANLLPQNVDGLDMASAGQPVSQMFLAGDIRANEHVPLSIMHTVFVRLHNIFNGQALGEGLIGDDAFARARNLTVAMLEHITDSEFIPALFGEQWYCEPLLESPTAADAASVRMSNFFSVGTSRYGHSMVSNDTVFEGHESLTFGQLFFNPTVLRSSPSIEPFLRGLYNNVARASDMMMTDGLRNILFAHEDLAARNIQRGRDTGLLPYNALRIAAGFPPMQAFSDFITDPAQLAAFESVYPEGPDLCDSWVCGLAEAHVAGSILGETFTELNRRQLCELKRNNPNHFERSEGLSAQDVINTKSRTMKWVLCTTVGGYFCTLDSANAFVVKPASDKNWIAVIYTVCAIVLMLFASIVFYLEARAHIKR